MNIFEWLRLIVGLVSIFVLPGFSWSFLFFQKRELDWVERLGISIGLSLVLVVMVVFWLHWLVGFKVTLPNTLGVVIFLAAFPPCYFRLRRSPRWSMSIARVVSGPPLATVRKMLLRIRTAISNK